GFTPMHLRRIPKIHNSRPDRARPTTSPPVCPRHPLKDGLLVGFVLAKTRPFFEFASEQVETGACVFFGVVPSFTPRLDFAAAPFLGEPGETGFEWPAARVVVHQSRVEAVGVADL